jgi:WD40 repeat protein
MSGLTPPPPPRTTGPLRPGWTTRLPEYPRAVAFSARGDRLWALDAAGGLRAFDPASGRLLGEALAHPGGGQALAVHPAGGPTATAGEDGSVALWGDAPGAPLDRWAGPGGWVERLAWCPAGERLAWAAARHVEVRGPGGARWRAPPRPGAVCGLAWTPAGELVTASAGEICVWRPPAPEPVARKEWPGAFVSMALRPDGEVVACAGHDRRVHIWRRSSGDDAEMSGYPYRPTALAFDAAGQWLATGGSERVFGWSFAGAGPEGTRPLQLELHARPVSALAFTRRGATLASGGLDGGVGVWGLRGGTGGCLAGAVVGAPVAALAWRPDDRALAVADQQGGLSALRWAG